MDVWSATWSDYWGFEMPEGTPVVIPVREATTGEVLYGDRHTSYRWEVLTHQPDGTDALAGVLDGVIESTARLSWSLSAQVKGSGSVKITDLGIAQPGMLRIGELSLESVRIRPVRMIEGLPEEPLSLFLMSAAPEEWSGTGRVWSVELLDRCTVLAQDKAPQSYSVPKGTSILQAVATVVAGAGEHIEIDRSATEMTSADMVWDAGTTWLTIVNDLLDAGGYNALWVDGFGLYRATKYVLPAERGTTYEVLGMPRELVDGEDSIYAPDWTRDRDHFDIPNRVVAVQSAGGKDSTALVGQWDNSDPNSPFGYPKRGRWIVNVLTGVDVPEGTDAEKIAFLQQKARRTLIALSSGKAVVKVKALPIPARVGDVLRFSSSPADVDARHTITRIELEAHPLGLCDLELSEVTDL